MVFILLSLEYDRRWVQKNGSNLTWVQGGGICFTGRIGRARSPRQGLWGVEWSVHSLMAFLSSTLLWLCGPRGGAPAPPFLVSHILSHYLPYRPSPG